MLVKRIDEARKAFQKKDVTASVAAHDPALIEQEYWHKTGQGKYVGPAVYGACDGIVTTFAVVAGVAGAKLPATVVLIMGLANLLADGLSMAMGDYLSGRAEERYRRSERERELWEIEHYPEGEKEKIKLALAQ